MKLSLPDIALALRRPDAAAELFGPLPPPGATDDHLAELRSAYRRLAALVHPDRHPRNVQLATETFQRLEALRAERERALLGQPFPALPGPAQRGGRAVVVRPKAAPVVDYEEEEVPPLPACPCVHVARSSLPGRVIFCTRGEQDVAVRNSDHRAMPIAHSWGCSQYRGRYPSAVAEGGVTLQDARMSLHLSGWSWTRAALEQQVRPDPFMAWTR